MAQIVSPSAKVPMSVLEQLRKVKSVEIGDWVEIGPDVQITGTSYIKIDEYTKIHRNSLLIARGPIDIGPGCWIGERSVLDGTGGLTMGAFVGVGVGSALYSHIKHGDVTEGSKYHGEKPLIIGDDAWFVGECLVSPVVIGKKAVAMLGSVVTKDMQENHVYGGNPARDLTDKLGEPWAYVSIDEKVVRVNGLLDLACKEYGLADRRRFEVVTEWPHQFNEGIRYYNVGTREYFGGHLMEHIRVHQWLLSSRAKFKPNRTEEAS